MIFVVFVLLLFSDVDGHDFLELLFCFVLACVLCMCVRWIWYPFAKSIVSGEAWALIDRSVTDFVSICLRI